MDTGAGALEAKTAAKLASKLAAGDGALPADAKSASKSASLPKSHAYQEIEGRGRGGLHTDGALPAHVGGGVSGGWD